MFDYDYKGIKVKNAELWLDALRKVPFSFISHGHSDHLKNHTKVLATPPTLRFHALRSRQTEVLALEFGRRLEFDGMTVQLFPAGHIIGSAMIRIEKDGVSLLYSGDFKLQPGLTAEPIEIPQADILIMESTYGHPEYTVDKGRAELYAELGEFIEDCFLHNYTPVVLAYSLGKAQEAMKIIGDCGYRVHVHTSAWVMAEIYREFGVEFRNCLPWIGEPLPPREVLIIPPHLARSRRSLLLGRCRTVFLSGWNKGSHGPRWQADHIIPLSDHADFNDLQEFVLSVHPQKIFTTHGFSQFPHHLRELGFEAQLLAADYQSVG